MAFALEHFFLPKRAATVALSRNAFEIAFQASERDQRRPASLEEVAVVPVPSVMGQFETVSCNITG